MIALALAARLEEVQGVAFGVLDSHQGGGAEGADGPVQGEHVEVVRHAIGEDLGGDAVAVEGEVLRTLAVSAGNDLAGVGGEAGAGHAGVAGPQRRCAGSIPGRAF